MSETEGAPTMTIHERMVAILSELPSIGKDARNEQQKFMYRSHDAVLNALNPLLAKHGVFVVPYVLERIATTRTTKSGSLMYEVDLHVQFSFYGLDGDVITTSAWGEGTDSGDKSTNKAMTMAFKNALAVAFAISTEDTIDADGHTPEETVKEFDPETDLVPGAITGKDAPKEIAGALNGLDSTVAWPEVITSISNARYKKVWTDLDGADARDFWRRLSNATFWMQQVAAPGEFPPIDADEIQAQIARAFSGLMVEIHYREREGELTAEQQKRIDEALLGGDGDDIPLGPGEESGGA